MSLRVPSSCLTEPLPLHTMSSNGDSGKSYHLRCTGDALKTADEHSASADVILFGGCFCPFVQRVWAALEYTGMAYQVCHIVTCRRASD